MTTNVKNRMDKLSVKIDQQIKKGSSQAPFSSHFANWWKSLNTECGELYEKAGQERPPSVNPEDARKWLNDQITKLHNFLSSYDLK